MDLKTYINHLLPENITQASKDRICRVVVNMVNTIFTNTSSCEIVSRKNISDEFRQLLTIGLFTDQHSQNYQYFILENKQLNAHLSHHFSRWTNNAKLYFLNALYITIQSITEFGLTQWEIDDHEIRPLKISYIHFDLLLSHLEDLLI
jgi:hypothetical protein